MLRDRPMLRDFIVAVGPELFYQDNPMGLDFRNVCVFRDRLGLGPFSFVYYAIDASPTYGPQQAMFDKLLGFKVPFAGYILCPLGLRPDWVMGAMGVADVIYSPEFTQQISPQPTPELRCSREGVVDSLLHYNMSPDSLTLEALIHTANQYGR